MRRLLVRERVVPADRKDNYRAAWRDVLNAAITAGVNAWIFQSAASDDRFIEFVEWKGVSVAPPGDVNNALDALEMIAPALAAGSWKEWK
ncbi:MAG TPA: hypothetical protein VF035_09565 [Longimicrobiales bacterium]